MAAFQRERQSVKASYADAKEPASEYHMKGNYISSKYDVAPALTVKRELKFS